MAIEDEVMFDTDDVASTESENLIESDNRVVNFVTGKFKRAEDARLSDEERWLKAYKNYRGLYSSDVQFTETEKSRVFVKVTKTKTLAAYGQIIDVLFGTTKFPLTIDPTTLPDGVADSVHINIDPNAEKGMNELKTTFETATNSSYLFGPDTELQAGDTEDDLQKRLGPLKDKLSSVSEKVIEGAGGTQSSISFHPAMVAAKKMEKKIHDQLEES